jgi:hypothetical protein
MKIYPSEQVTALATAIVKGYPTAVGQARIKMMLRSLNVDFDDYAVPNAIFELTLNDILLDLNQSAGLSALFAKLAEDPRPKVTEAVDAMVAEEVAQRPPGFELLARALLIVDGDPLVDHENLAKIILPSLLNDIEPLRAVVMTGPTDSGKTFSLGLIRRLCRESVQNKKFLPATIDLVTLESTRDCKKLAGQVVRWLKLDQFIMPPVDTSESKIGQRLVEELVIAREQSERFAPTLLVFDHLDKDVSPSIIDFVEEIALAAAKGTLKDVRVVLIGFPRAPATTFPRGKLISDIVVQPNPALVFKYIDQALDILDRDMEDEALATLVNKVFAGQQQPYPRPFMAELPEKIRDLLEDIMKAPTNG